MYIIGKALKPKGLKGEIKVKIITSFPEHFQELKKIFIKNNSGWQAYSIESVKLRDRFAFIKLSGIDSVEQAETLRDNFLYIDKDALKPLSGDEFYIHDLIGLRVFAENGDFLGRIVDVESYSSNDLYILKGTDGKKHLLPAIKDVVKSVVPEQGKMVIHLMEGLWD